MNIGIVFLLFIAIFILFIAIFIHVYDLDDSGQIAMLGEDELTEEFQVSNNEVNWKRDGF